MYGQQANNQYDYIKIASIAIPGLSKPITFDGIETKIYVKPFPKTSLVFSFYTLKKCRFNEDPGSQKKILPQYDDPSDEEVSFFF